MAKVICKVSELRTDRTNYKMYSPVLLPEDVYVEIDQEKIEGRSEDGRLVLSENGFSALLDEVAVMVDKANQIYNKRIMEGN